MQDFPVALPAALTVPAAAAFVLCSGMLLGASCAKAPPKETDWGSMGSGGSKGPAPVDGLTPVQRHGKLSVSGTDLVDERGAIVQLKGPSSMWLHWENSGYAHDPAGIQFFRDDWRASVIRTAMGIEPPGAFLSNPESAKADARAVIDNAIALGMYVIIDWHDHNAHLNRAQAVAFFTEIAAEYGDTPNVLYEPFNEPMAVSWMKDVRPYHEAVVAAIRAVDPDNVIILGTPNWSQYVDEAAQNPVPGINLMYTLHFYSCTHSQPFRTRGDRARALGVALFVTEWGATDADGGTPKNPMLCLAEAQAWHNWMNAKHISWTAWKLDDCADQSCFFKPGAPTTGGWPDAQLNGHGPFVRDRMRD
ncbi:MAG: glycoside hydrolase family 5 protein [Deltaproteobacteria bacterium]|nr:glycoside hydrolase family 5 protein [Deltaproteobacteria bacterium]